MTGPRSGGRIAGQGTACAILEFVVPAAADIVASDLPDDAPGAIPRANKTVATTGAAMSKSEKSHKSLDDGARDSLRAKMKAIKKAVSAQYGRGRSQYAEVKGRQL